MYTAHLARFNQLECEQALSQVQIQNLMYNMYKHLFENYVFQNPMDKCQSQWSHHVHRQDHRTPSLSCDSDRIAFHHRTAYDCLEITDWLQGTLPNLKSGKMCGIYGLAYTCLGSFLCPCWSFFWCANRMVRPSSAQFMWESHILTVFFDRHIRFQLSTRKVWANWNFLSDCLNNKYVNAWYSPNRKGSLPTFVGSLPEAAAFAFSRRMAA